MAAPKPASLGDRCRSTRGQRSCHVVRGGQWLCTHDASSTRGRKGPTRPPGPACTLGPQGQRLCVGLEPCRRLLPWRERGSPPALSPLLPLPSASLLHLGTFSTCPAQDPPVLTEVQRDSRSQGESAVPGVLGQHVSLSTPGPPVLIPLLSLTPWLGLAHGSHVDTWSPLQVCADMGSGVGPKGREGWEAVFVWQGPRRDCGVQGPKGTGGLLRHECS